MFDHRRISWWQSGELHLQGSLLAFVEPAVDQSFGGVRRILLDEQSWLDHQSGWLRGDQVVFDRLVLGLPWDLRVVEMWGQHLLEPRLTSWWSVEDGPEPLPILGTIRRLLTERYDEAFDSIGFNCYRRGTDSLGWHRDRRHEPIENPVVATISLGAPRPFRLRPAGGGRSMSLQLGNGDLIVMGGACQHRWEHCIPKTRHAEPRISMTYRHGPRASDSVSDSVAVSVTDGGDRAPPATPHSGP